MNGIFDNPLCWYEPCAGAEPGIRESVLLMEFTVDIEFGKIASELGLDRSQVEVTVHLLDDGNTVPFITRYRKEQTRGLDEVKIRQI